MKDFLARDFLALLENDEDPKPKRRKRVSAARIRAVLQAWTGVPTPKRET